MRGFLVARGGLMMLTDPFSSAYLFNWFIMTRDQLYEFDPEAKEPIPLLGPMPNHPSPASGQPYGRRCYSPAQPLCGFLEGGLQILTTKCTRRIVVSRDQEITRPSSVMSRGRSLEFTLTRPRGPSRRLPNPQTLTPPFSLTMFSSIS